MMSGLLAPLRGFRAIRHLVRSSTPRHSNRIDLHPWTIVRQSTTRCARGTLNSKMPGSIFVVDFDDTLTEGDTIGLLIDACINAKSAGEPVSPGITGPDEIRRELEAKRDHLVAQYGTAFSELMAHHLPEGGICREEALDMEVASGFLDDVTEFEKRMNDVVVESGILSGAQEKDIEAAARLVRLRPGAAETLHMALSQGWQVHVLSVNWSASLIRAVLAAFPCRVACEGESAASTDEGVIYIHSNNLEMALGISTGRMIRRVQGPLDKGNYLEDILLDNAAMTGRGNRTCVYVGDSIGDLAALLVADFPIVLGKNATLRRATTAFGCFFVPLADCTMRTGSLAVGGMHAADDWHQIFAFLFPDDAMPSLPAPAPAASEASASGEPETEAPSTPAAAAAADGVPSDVAAASVAAANDAAAAAAVPEDDSNADSAAAAAAAGDAQAPDTANREGLRIRVASSRNFALMPSASQPEALPDVPTGASIPRVLTIAGSDSGAGAGIQADLKSILANGAFGVTAVTALTAQNSHGVQGVHAVPTAFLQQQIDSVTADFEVNVIKTGMLPDAAAVEAVAECVRAGMARAPHTLRAVVVDPVMVSTSGHALGGADVAAAMKRSLFPLATLITPNLEEASSLLGGRTIETLEDMHLAAKDLCALGPLAVLLKGGHFNATGAHFTPGMTLDVLCEGVTVTELPVKRLLTGNTHGTGCTLASAIAANLAKGHSIEAAVRSAQQYVHHCLELSQGLPLGTGVQRPMNHCARYTRWGRPRPSADYSLYAVTDPRMNARHGRSMHDAVRAAIEGGATIIQVREKDCDGGDFVATVRAAIDAARPQGVRVIVNDRVDVALAAGADGVHIGQSDIPCSLVRKMVGDTMIVGVSTKTVEQALLAESDGADYVGVGACYPTQTKDSPAIGPPAVAEIVLRVGIPVVAIGGINASRVAECMATGCAGVAVVSAVFDQADIKAATQELAAAVRSALSVKPALVM